MQVPTQIQYQCASGIQVRRGVLPLNYRTAIDELATALNSHRGVLLASSFEYPGRYTRWDIGFINPPLVVIARDRQVNIEALNQRGKILLPEIYTALQTCQAIAELSHTTESITAIVAHEDFAAAEEERSRRPSVFSVLRTLVECFSSQEDPYLGLYGAFGYDLTFQFENVNRYQRRDDGQRDLVLYLPDQITVADHRAEQTLCFSYEFNCRGWDNDNRTETTGGFRRAGESVAYAPAIHAPESCDHQQGEFAEQVERALDYFKRGDLFEVVPGQCFYEPCKDSPADVFKRLKNSNPAPYGALINLGENEYLVAASPEMFVRVDGRQIETCPISGTIKRGEDAISDASQIRHLLNSEKDESELSMCTDVDRNDKARVCEPGSVTVVGRRQIEMYSRLIHTVDHVKGILKQQFDALDGFLAHTWAVTVTGAPKLAAMQYIEEFEKSPRHWYGGAMGHIGFDGNLNTGLTLRTLRIKDGIAEIRAGATLLIDSDPQAEEEETRLKASALIDAVRGNLPATLEKPLQTLRPQIGVGLKLLMVDHQDSFVHNLAAYFREYGVDLITLRPEPARNYLANHSVDLVILSPGPSNPEHFNMQATIDLCVQKDLPIFGVCLGLQGLVEYFGGELDMLPYPMHGKSSVVNHDRTPMFDRLDSQFDVGRYHSLVASKLPDSLLETARTADGAVMAVEHRSLPIRAVQFHPESIMSLDKQSGHQIIENIISLTVNDKQLTKVV
ncbi:MAG: anthranilate synthase component I [Pseudomonadales bacterium]|nr:anthranilate synthase component I [Pseudomonadales bacterium]